MPVPEIIAAVAVPFTEAGGIDVGAFRSNLDRMRPLLDGVFVAGTTGEFPALEDDERISLFETALQSFGPERTVAHVGAASTRQALRLARQAASVGVRRFAAITPYYQPASVAGTADYYAALRDVVADGELYAYIFPDVAGTDVLPADLPRLVRSGIDGVKLSGKAAGRVDDYAREMPAGFSMWSGNDADVPRVLAAGGRGAVSGVSCVLPELWAELRDAYRRGDDDAVDIAQVRILSVVPVLGRSIANLKYVLEKQGFGRATCRMSIDPPDLETRKAIDRLLSV